jgi:predicted trehalose synthase
VSAAQYTVAVFRALDEFQDADQDFRAAWPERRFRDRSSFKRDFVTFEHRTRCLTSDVVAAGSPDGLGEVVTDLHAYLALVNDSIAMGREAVESRNASAYRDWISEIDVLVVGYTDFQTRLQQAR